MLDLPPTQYQQAVAEIRAYIAEEAKLPLQKGSETRLLAHPDVPPRGTLVMYHGFTAGTWQFEQLAKEAYAAGYNVYIPRLPGHGLKDAAGVEDPSRLVTQRDRERYRAFAEETYQEARALGGPVHVMGLSVGGSLAMAVAERHPEVATVTAYAPFLEVRAGGWLFSVFRVLDKLTFNHASRLLDLVPWGWGEACERQTASGERPGHSKFSLGNIYAASEMGREVMNQASKIQAPVQFFVTANDDAVRTATLRKAHDNAGGDPENGWFFFPAEEKVPHPMVHPKEANGAQHIEAMYANTLRFLDTRTPIDRGE